MKPGSRLENSIVIQTGLLAVLMGALVWSIAPDVNEAHYLVKARHFFDREFCPHDLFANSHETHWLFYLTHGWLFRFLEFESVAWLGRGIAWCVTAWGLIRLGRVVENRFANVIMGGGLVIILNDQLNLAGEWLAGGVEAKCYAYGFAFGALACWMEKKTIAALPLLGLACAFHIVIGCWFLIAFVFAKAIEVRFDARHDHAAAGLRQRLQPPWWILICCGLLFLTGVIPALLQDFGTERSVILEAGRIQSMWRLAHHQLATEFHHWFRFLPMVAVWAVLANVNRQSGGVAMARLNRVVAGSLLISLAGVLLSLLATGCDLKWLQSLCAKLLTLYWFRLSDVLVPAGCVLNAMWFLKFLTREHLHLTGVAPLVTVVAWMAIGWFVTDNFLESRTDPRSASAKQTIALPDDPALRKREWEAERNWIRTCLWIRDKTSFDAVFLTPFDQQTFKWYAHRTEVASRKDMPQDAESVLEWYRRLTELYLESSSETWKPGDPPSQAARQFRPLLYSEGLPFDAQYLVIEQWVVDEFSRVSELPQHLRLVYPEPGQRKSTFAVFQSIEKNDN